MPAAVAIAAAITMKMAVTIKTIIRNKNNKKFCFKKQVTNNSVRNAFTKREICAMLCHNFTLYDCSCHKNNVGKYNNKNEY